MASSFWKGLNNVANSVRHGMEQAQTQVQKKMEELETKRKLQARQGKSVNVQPNQDDFNADELENPYGAQRPASGRSQKASKQRFPEEVKKDEGDQDEFEVIER